MTTDPAYNELLLKIEDLEHRIETFRSMLDNSPDLFYRTDLEGRLTYVSSSVYRLSGYTVEEAIGMKLADEVYLFPEERLKLLGILQEKGCIFNFEAQLKRKDGTIWWASTNAQFLKDENGIIIGVEGITRDISELKAAETALRESEERFRLAFHTSPDSINLNRASDGMYIDINEGFTNLMGYTREDVIGKTSTSLNIWKDPADRKRLVEGLAESGLVKNLESQFVRKDGQVGVGLMSARLLRIKEEDYILSVTRDITEEKQAQTEKEHVKNQLAQVQKLESVGRLAGGVAHDLNNLLSPILGYSQILLHDMADDEPNKGYLKQIEKAAINARDLVHQLLAFSRKQTLEYKTLDLNEAVREFEILMQRTIREDIKFETLLSSHIRKIMADVSQIQQVIMNLAVNAVDAMPNGGILSIETSMVVLDENYAAENEGVTPGTYAMLAVSDTGHGMDESTRSQIFEPFFSTKGRHGTGLGLATVYGIVKQHGGKIDRDVRRKPGLQF